MMLKAILGDQLLRVRPGTKFLRALPAVLENVWRVYFAGPVPNTHPWVSMDGIKQLYYCGQ